MRVDAARDPPEPDEPVIEPRLDDPFPITVKNRCSRKIDIQSPIWNLDMEITAFSFKLQANVTEGRKRFPISSISQSQNTYPHGCMAVRSNRVGGGVRSR